MDTATDKVPTPAIEVTPHSIPTLPGVTFTETPTAPAITGHTSPPHSVTPPPPNANIPSEVELLTMSQPSMTITGSIWDIDCFILIDTGSSISVLNVEFLETLPNKPTLETPLFSAITTVDGGESPILGQLHAPLIIDDTIFPTQFQVLTCGKYDVILGRDFLSQHKALINIATNTLTIASPQNEQRLSLSLGPDECLSPLTKQTVARLLNTITIDPYTEVVTPTYLTDNLFTDTVILEGLEHLDQHSNAIVAASICLPTTFSLPCRIMNPTPHSICLNKDFPIALATEIASYCELNSLETIKPTTPTLDPIAFQVDDKNLPAHQKKQLLQTLTSYRDVFAKDDSELGHTTLLKHTINVENATPIRARPYRTNQETRAKLKQHIDTMLQSDIIQESSSPWASPIILVKKKDGTDRFVCDFRALNGVTVKDSFPLPRIDDTLDSLGGAIYFSTLDLRAGYHQVEVSNESREFTAFTSYDGLYEFKRLPFGLCNAPSTFQRLMDLVLRGLTWEICLIYLDDVICFSKTFDEHLLNLTKIFDRLREANLKLKPSKCFFLQQSVEFLGHIVSAQGIQPNPSKVEVIRSIQPPRTAKQVKQYLGLLGYYRRFIPGFAKLANPLNKLLRKDEPFAWTPACQTAFDELKNCLMSPPILAFPDFTQEFHLTTDASTEAVGQILSQIQNGVERVIAYAGRTLTKAERNYSITELEALAILQGLKHFHCYLYGRKFVIITDHAALKWVFQTKELKGRHARWALTLQSYDYTIKHKPGKANINADALSRLQPSPTTFTCDTTGYTPQRIYKAQRADPDLIQLILFLESNIPYTHEVPSEVAQDNAIDFFLDSNSILYKTEHHPKKPYDATFLLVIPTSLRQEILLNCHDAPTAGHFAFDKTYAKVCQRYWWPTMFSQITDWIKTCKLCMARKRPYGQKPAPLQPLPIGYSFDRVAMDILGPVTLTRSGNRYILVFTDYRTKWPEAAALPSIEAPRVARCFFDLIITRHSSPHTILSDRGSNFLSLFMKEIYIIMNVSKVNTTAYHPQTNGQCERFNSTLVNALTMYCNANQDNWDDFLQGILFGFRTSISKSTNETPFFMLYGRRARLPLDVSLLPPSQLSVAQSVYRSMIVKNLAAAQQLAADRNDLYQTKMKENYDKRTAPTKFQVGQKVLLHDPTKKQGLTKKLSPQYLGPFTIVEQKSPCHFRLTGMDKRVNDLVHVNRLKLCPEPSSTSLRTPAIERPLKPLSSTPPVENTNPVIPPQVSLPTLPTSTHTTPPLIDTTHTAPPQIERKILNHRRRQRRLEYLIKDITAADSTANWVPADQLGNDPCVTPYLHSQANYPMTRAKARSLTNPSVHVLDVITIPTIPPLRAQPLPPPIFMKLRIITTLAVVLLLYLITPAASTPHLGTLYNCDMTKYLGAYTLPLTLTCNHDFTTNNVSTYTAEVRKYQPPVTHFFAYLCTVQRIILTCKEKFWGTKNKMVVSKRLLVSPNHCERAVRSKATQYGRLFPTSPNQWKTKNAENYHCKWLKTRKVTFQTFLLHRYPVTLQGTDAHVHQALTHTICQYNTFYCIPHELPRSVIVWNKQTHVFSLFTSLGTHTVKQIHRFILIPKLAIGGSIILQDGGTFLLDVGYEILKQPFSKVNQTFQNASNQYVTETRSNVQRELGEGRLTEALITESEVISHLAASLCNTNLEIRHLQRWLLSAFPDVAAPFLFPGLGKLVEPRGEAFLIHACQPVHNYHIFWNQSFRNSCYHTFPVLTPKSKKPFFLELPTRRLISQGHKIPCAARPQYSYVNDIDNQLWQLTLPVFFKKVQQYAHTPLHSHVTLPKIAHFDLHLLHHDHQPPTRISLLQLLARQKDNLEDLTKFRTIGEGNIISGIGMVLGDTIAAISSGGSQIIRALGLGIRDTLNGVSDLDESVVGSIGNATSNVITSTTTGFAKILSSIGGLSNLLLWALVFLLYCYLFCMRFPNAPCPCLFSPHLRKPEAPSDPTPPLPPRIRFSNVHQIDHEAVPPADL